MNRSNAGVSIPITFILPNRIPLRFSSFKRNARQTGAILERPISYVRHACRYRYTRQTGATAEHLSIHIPYSVSNRYAHQALTPLEQTGSYTRHCSR